jgi:hypothetical protein
VSRPFSRTDAALLYWTAEGGAAWAPGSIALASVGRPAAGESRHLPAARAPSALHAAQAQTKPPAAVCGFTRRRPPATGGMAPRRVARRLAPTGRLRPGAGAARGFGADIAQRYHCHRGPPAGLVPGTIPLSRKHASTTVARHTSRI